MKVIGYTLGVLIVAPILIVLLSAFFLLLFAVSLFFGSDRVPLPAKLNRLYQEYKQRQLQSADKE
jgi:hypothetical protein